VNSENMLLEKDYVHPPRTEQQRKLITISTRYIFIQD